MILGWTPLQASARERRLQLVALAAALAVTCALTAAALLADPRHPVRLWAATLVCAACALVVAWRLRAPRAPALEVAIDAHGVPLLRATTGVATDAGAPPARCLFAAPWLITLRCGAVRAPIWPDSMPAEAFRRLHACVRWASAAPDAGHSPAPDPS